MHNYTPYPFSFQEVDERITQAIRQSLPFQTTEKSYQFIINCLDLTTLEGRDNQERIYRLCYKAKNSGNTDLNIKEVAAVCIYPPFVNQAKALLAHTPIKVASVAGAFPSGQSPLHVKISEIKYALEEGADEIDMVISRGKFLAGRYQEVFDEIAAIKELCGEKTLKVILETGELGDHNSIFIASQLAIAAGADFIKTSTGKINVNATPASFTVMLDAIAYHYKKTGKMVGIKAAGGISDASASLLYLKILNGILGEKWLDNKYFRIGASRLFDSIMNEIT